MPNDEFAPNLTKLERNYEILSELHREGASRTYLARHLGLNRDVTITVVGAGIDDVTLSHLASDARLLATMRHRNIIPIVEGIWLDGHTFAVVRARVRGSRLDHMIEKTGPIPIGQVATTIQSVRDAISWARENGIVHRRVTPSSVTFQQGNQRVFLTLELASPSRGAIPDECDDVRTIGVLASDMMLGRITRAGEPVSAVSIPPNMLTAVTRSIIAVRRCHAGNVKQVVGSLLTALQSAADEAAAAEPVGAAVAPHAVELAAVERFDAVPMAIATVVEPTRSRTEIERDYVDGVAVVDSRFGFNARLGSAVAAAAIIGVLAFLSLRHRSTTPNVGVSAAPSDTHAQAAGDVSPTTTHAGPRPATPRPTAALPSPPKSANGVDSRACRSPSAADQRTCLIAAIERNDQDMNAVYTKLIRALRRQSSATAGDPDPGSVSKLRRSQRKWIDDRDVACRKVGRGPLYAPERSSCFAQQSADRTRELQKMLDAVPPGH
jgi:uncharacterized protein YecT (DUF1311 family)